MRYLMRRGTVPRQNFRAYRCCTDLGLDTEYEDDGDQVEEAVAAPLLPCQSRCEVPGEVPAVVKLDMLPLARGNEPLGQAGCVIKMSKEKR